MMAAAGADNAATVSDLLGIDLRDSAIQPQKPGTDQDRWESDGGSGGQPALVRVSGASARS